MIIGENTTSQEMDKISAVLRTKRIKNVSIRVIVIINPTTLGYFVHLKNFERADRHLYGLIVALEEANCARQLP